MEALCTEIAMGNQRMQSSPAGNRDIKRSREGMLPGSEQNTATDVHYRPVPGSLE